MALSYCCLGSESELGRVLRSSIVSRLLTRSTGSAARLPMRYRSVETGSGPCSAAEGSTAGGYDHPMRALLMRTCLADMVAPSVPRAAARGAASAAGVEVAVPRRQTCCGQPAWSSGPSRPGPAGGPPGAARVRRRRPGRRALGLVRGDDPPRLPRALRRTARGASRPWRWPSAPWSCRSSWRARASSPRPERVGLGDLPRLLPHAAHPAREGEPAGGAGAASRGWSCARWSRPRCAAASAARSASTSPRCRATSARRRPARRRPPAPTSWWPATSRACSTSWAAPGARASRCAPATWPRCWPG